MRNLIFRLVINAVALYIAVVVMNGHGITAQSENWLSILLLAIIFGIINAFLRPILTVLSLPFLILTLGLGTLLINTFLFYLTGIIGSNFGIGFTVEGFWPAFWGALVVSCISFILNIFLKDEKKKNK